MKTLRILLSITLLFTFFDTIAQTPQIKPNINKNMVKNMALKGGYSPGIKVNIDQTTLNKLKSMEIPVASEPSNEVKDELESTNTVLTPRNPTMNNLEVSSLVGMYTLDYWEVRPYTSHATLNIYSHIAYPNNQMLVIKLGRSRSENANRKVPIGIGGLLREYPIFSNGGVDYVVAPFEATTSNYYFSIYPMIDNNRNYYPLRIEEIKLGDLSSELF